MPDNRIQLIIEAVNKTESAFADLKKSIKGIEDETARTSQTSGGLLTKMKANWMALSATAVAAYMAMQKALEYIDLGAKAIQAETAFERTADSMKVNAGQMVEAMKKASSGTIDESHLMQKAIKAMAQDIDPAKIPALFEAARVAAVKSGEDISAVADQLVDSIANELPRGLRKFGLISKEEMAVFNKAIAAGATNVKLLDLVLANAAIQEAKMGVEAYNAAIMVQQFKADTEELKENLGKGLIWILQKVVAMFQSVASAIFYAIEAYHRLQVILEKSELSNYGENLDPNSIAGKRKAAVVGRIQYHQAMAESAALSALGLGGKAAGNLGYETPRQVKTQADLDAKLKKAEAQKKKLLDEMRAIPDKLEAAKNFEKLADEWKNTLAGMEAEVEKAKIDDAFGQQIFEIEKKAQELKEKFGKIPGASKKIDTLTAELMDTEAIKQGKKDYEEWLSIKREADEAGEREREEVAKEDIELQGKIKAAREGEIQSQLAELDLAEALGKSHKDTLTERIRLLSELKTGQEADLKAMDKLADPAGWYAQSSAIDQTKQKLAELQKELEAATGTMGEGFARGWQDWINNTKTAFENGKELATQTAQSMQSTFSNVFFDAYKGQLKSFKDYWVSFWDSIAQKLYDILAEMLVEWIATQAQMKVAAAAGAAGGKGGLFSSLLNIGMTVAGAFAGSSASTGAGAGTGGGLLSTPPGGNFFTPMKFEALHIGGIAGIDTVRLRYVPPFAFAGAPRLHQGLAPDEYPAILQRGEGVFTPGQMKALGGRQSPPVIVNMSVQAMDAQSFNGYVQQNKAAIAAAIMSAGANNHPVRRR